MRDDQADLVVVGAGAIGGWAAYFARLSGARKVVVVERGRAGEGASSRAAGMVRAQGGTPAAIDMGRWSIEFYRSQKDQFGADSGFRELGYLLLATTSEAEREGRERVAMQRETGLDARWLDPKQATEFNPWLQADSFLGASYLATDGCIDAPRNVAAYLAAMRQSRVDLREQTAFTGLRLESGRVVGVGTSRGPVDADRVLLTGGPTLREVGEMAGIKVPVAGVRHHVAVTEPPYAFQVGRQSMCFDVEGGLYWRLEDDGLLFGHSNPDERPGIAREIHWTYMDGMRERLATYMPVTAGLALRKVWAATIDYTPDHQPIIGPALTPDGTRLEGVTVAAAAGHGMMWGPAVARIAADLALEGKTSLTDVSHLGLDRFDSAGVSKLAPDPIALPFPTTT